MDMATSCSAPMAAIVVGGTGATGKKLVRMLLQAKDKVSKVTLLSRRAITSLDGVDLSAEESSGRLIQHVEELDTVGEDKVIELCTGGSVFFCCLGTSASLAFLGSSSDLRKAAIDRPVRLARLAHQAGVPHYSVITGAVANPDSWFLNNRIKAELEAAAQDIFPHTSAFRPGMLDRENTKGYIEWSISYLLRSLPVSILAEAMFLDAWDYHTKQQSTVTSEGEGATGGDSNTISVFYDDDFYRITQK